MSKQQARDFSWHESHGFPVSQHTGFFTRRWHPSAWILFGENVWEKFDFFFLFFFFGEARSLSLLNRPIFRKLNWRQKNCCECQAFTAAENKHWYLLSLSIVLLIVDFCQWCLGGFKCFILKNFSGIWTYCSSGIWLYQWVVNLKRASSALRRSFLLVEWMFRCSFELCGWHYLTSMFNRTDPWSSVSKINVFAQNLWKRCHLCRGRNRHLFRRSLSLVAEFLGERRICACYPNLNMWRCPCVRVQKLRHGTKARRPTSGPTWTSWRGFFFAGRDLRTWLSCWWRKLGNTSSSWHGEHLGENVHFVSRVIVVHPINNSATAKTPMFADWRVSWLRLLAEALELRREWHVQEEVRRECRFKEAERIQI